MLITRAHDKEVYKKKSTLLNDTMNVSISLEALLSVGPTIHLNAVRLVFSFFLFYYHFFLFFVISDAKNMNFMIKILHANTLTHAHTCLEHKKCDETLMMNQVKANK